MGKSNLPEESDAEVGKVVRMCPGCGKASVRLSVDAMLGKVVASCSTAGCGSCTVQLSMPGASKGSSDGSGSGSSTSSKKSRGGTLNSQGIIVKPRPAGNGRASAVISKPGGKVQRVGERSGDDLQASVTFQEHVFTSHAMCWEDCPHIRITFLIDVAHAPVRNQPSGRQHVPQSALACLDLKRLNYAPSLIT